MSHQSLINAKSEPIPTHPPTFPARPIRGGKLELAPKKSGIWFAEPKYNGWRALVHTPTGAMWNRHGQRLTIEREFEAALDQLRPLGDSSLVWADCEALERRHQIGRGSLVVLDWIPESASPTYEERREFLARLVETEQLSTGEWQSFPENALFLPPSVRDEGSAVSDFYAGLKAINRRLRCDFFEGVVMSRPEGRQPAKGLPEGCVKAQQPGQCAVSRAVAKRHGGVPGVGQASLRKLTAPCILQAPPSVMDSRERREHFRCRVSATEQMGISRRSKRRQ